MKDPNRALRTAYYSALNGNVSLNGDDVPVYDTAVPRHGGYPCIVLTEQTNSDPILTKKCQHFEPTILVRCIAKSNMQYDVIGQDPVDMIAEQVYPLIIDLDMSPDFVCHKALIESDFTYPAEQAQDSTSFFSRDIRYRHRVEEL